jgi:hypothetical protein
LKYHKVLQATYCRFPPGDHVTREEKSDEALPTAGIFSFCPTSSGTLRIELLDIYLFFFMFLQSALRRTLPGGCHFCRACAMVQAAKGNLFHPADSSRDGVSRRPAPAAD